MAARGLSQGCAYLRGIVARTHDEGALAACVEEEDAARGVEGRRDAIIIWATDHYPLVMTPCRSMYTTWDVNGHRHTVATNPTIGTTVEMVSPVATSNP